MKLMSALEKENVNIVDSLISVFEELRKNKDHQKEIDEQLAILYGISRGTINELLNDVRKLEQLSQDELVVLCVITHKVTKDERSNPFNYYSQKAVSKALKYRGDQEETIVLPVTYNDVTFGSDLDYVCKVSYQEIAKSWASELWTYNKLIQRAPVKKLSKSGKISEKPKLKMENVREIEGHILEGIYKPDTITINVLNDGTDELFYNENDRELTIESATEINLVDGFHRVTAVMGAIEKNPDVEGYLYLSIRNYDFDAARDYLGQHNSFTTFDKTHVRQLKSSKLPDKIVNDVIFKSDLKGKVSSSTAVKRKFKELTNFAILSDTVKYAFDPETGKDRIDVSNALVRFFDYLIGSYNEAFEKDIEGVLKTSWINHHNTFVGYVIICSKLFKKYGKDFPVDEVTRIVDSINFSKESSEYNDLMTTQGKVNSNQVKAKIRKFFEEKTDELLA
jgi:hypothetical protein